MEFDAESFRLLADSSSNGWLVHDAKSKSILWANRTACEEFGYTVEELRSLKAHHMSSQDPRYRRSMGTAWLQAAVVYGSNKRLWKYANRDGDEFMTDAVATLVTLPGTGADDDGPADVILVEFRVLHEADVVPDSSKWVEDSLDRLMLHTSSGMMLLDRDYRVEDVSPFAAKLLGSSVEEMLGQRLDELADIDTPLDDMFIVAEMSKPDGAVTVRMKVSSDSGEVRWLAGILDNVVLDGSCIRVLTVRDISSKVEWERRNAYQEKNLQYMSRYNAMGDMAMILAHDLGQPIAAATNYLDGVRRRLRVSHRESEDLEYGLGQARSQLERVSDIVTSVKKYVRRIENVSTVVDLNDAVEESLYFVRLRAEDKGVEVITDLCAGRPTIVGESVLIGQVIINICVNAIDEIALPTTEEKYMVVSTEMTDDAASVVVRDRGRGMSRAPADMLAAGAFSSKSDGSGIGLVICEHIVQRHGGNITYESNDPRGTAVRISFPLSSP
ncbi:Two-component system, sensory histidine kinase [Corynebacterium glyciniphilum AJ 3170]|uniref:histidine kinase n=1 Tax=Corynebacterium glyciniphilum AJ 3170 TaxID=1404245 RepID=X5DVA6_9CORY|nr:ATP-binding protein [Corynebacterium glyciniphilum]AHW64587.1 Two-component system, sensory histidine kinase [Corynebacterium glyciniphilum AJ 3170]